jgi:hypothetical protein
MKVGVVRSSPTPVDTIFNTLISRGTTSLQKSRTHWGCLGTWEIPSFSTPELPGGTKPAEQVPGSWMGRTGMHESEGPESRGRWYRPAKATELAGRKREVLVP